MDDRNARRLAHAGRLASALLSVGLIAWACSDDPLIGGAPGFGWTQGALLLLALVLAASCLAPPAWNARTLSVIVSAGLAICAAEFALQRLVAPRYYAPYQMDARALLRPVPGAVREHRRLPINGGDRIVYRFNSAGFRGEELDASRRDLRILVYGDSFIMGEFSTLPNTFAERLEHHVSKRLGTPVEAVNAGVAAYGPDQILRRMEGELAALGPDLVVVAIFTGNDFGDSVRNKLYRLDPEGAVRENAWTLDPTLRSEMERTRKELILKKIVRNAVFGVAAHWGWGPQGRLVDVEQMTPRERMEFFLEQRVGEYQEYVVLGDNVVRRLAWDSYDADVSLTPASDAARYKIDLIDGLLARMQGVADGVSVPLVFVLIPHPIDVCGHESAEVDRERYPEYEPRATVEILEKIALRHDLETVELFGPFQQRDACSLYFRGLDDHWNDLGQDVAADVVAEFLVSSQLLEGVSLRLSPQTESGE